MSNMNMNWQSDGFTVYALNEQGVNDFSFHVQGNGRDGHDQKALQKIVSMAEAAPDMYRALREFVGNSSVQTNFPHECEVAEAALAKADGEV